MESSGDRSVRRPQQGLFYPPPDHPCVSRISTTAIPSSPYRLSDQRMRFPRLLKWCWLIQFHVIKLVPLKCHRGDRPETGDRLWLEDLDSNPVLTLTRSELQSLLHLSEPPFSPP
jgi:hypothetical protein